MAFLWAIRQHDGSVGTTEAGWSSAGSAQGQEFTHMLSITRTHTHTRMGGCVPKPNIHNLQLGSKLAERVRPAQARSGDKKKKNHYPIL